MVDNGDTPNTTELRQRTTATSAFSTAATTRDCKKNVIISDVVKVWEAWRGQAWRDTQRLLITAGASVDGPPKRCSAAALPRYRLRGAAAVGPQRQWPARPPATALVRSNESRSLQVRPKKIKTNQAKSGQDTSHNVDSLTRSAFWRHVQ